MKTAILLSGNIRTWENTKSSFISFFSELNPDIFVTTYNKQYDYHPMVAGNMNDFSDNNLTECQIVDLFQNLNVINIDIENSIDCSDYNQVHPNMQHEHSWKQCRKINRGLRIIEQHEINNNFQYDFIIKSRFDLVYRESIKLKPIKNHVIIDAGNVFPNDCIITSSRNDMIEMYKFMMQEYSEYSNVLSSNNPPHGVLHTAINKIKREITSHKLVEYVLRKNNIKKTY